STSRILPLMPTTTSPPQESSCFIAIAYIIVAVSPRLQPFEGTNIFTLCAETSAVMMMGVSAIVVSAAAAPTPTSDASITYIVIVPVNALQINFAGIEARSWACFREMSAESRLQPFEGTNIFTLCAERSAVMMMGVSAIVVSAAAAPTPTSDASITYIVIGAC
ncbi:hypothetical protein Tco_0044778, partial [Tanacetum coccineum]